ncbi:MAG TPA: hypothetical protein DCY38_05760 [Opitutae bacterium]|nr:hypothetical protein [Opitutae bacterium]
MASAFGLGIIRSLKTTYIMRPSAGVQFFNRPICRFTCSVEDLDGVEFAKTKESFLIAIKRRFDLHLQFVNSILIGRPYPSL